MLKYILAALIGYLFGAIQTGFLLGKVVYKKDIRSLGNGNAGASNAVVAFGKTAGIITGAVDIIKAVIAVLIIRLVYENSVSTEVFWNLSYLAGFMVILGHNYPFYMKFRGGKGTAALVGMMFIVDIRLGIVGVLTMAIVAIVTDYIVLGTMSLLLVVLLFTIFFRLTPMTIILMLILISMSIYKHHANFIRIKHKEETRIRGTLY